MVNKTCILDKVKEFYGLKSNKALSEFLGVTKQTISNWYSRNTLDYDIILTKCKDVDLHWLLLGSTERPVNSEIEDNTEISLGEEKDETNAYQGFKEFNGMSSLFNYLIKRYNYSTEEKRTANISNSINSISDFINRHYIWENFYRLYEKFKNEQITKEELLSEFENLITIDKKAYLLLNKYEEILYEISNTIFDYEFPNFNISDYVDENGNLRI